MALFLMLIHCMTIHSKIIFIFRLIGMIGILLHYGKYSTLHKFGFIIHIISSSYYNTYLQKIIIFILFIIMCILFNKINYKRMAITIEFILIILTIYFN